MPRSISLPALAWALIVPAVFSCTPASTSMGPDGASGGTPAGLPTGTAGVAGPPAVVTVCSQNLWNYGAAEEVLRYRRPSTPIEKIRSDLEAQDSALAERFAGCDIVAVQEIVGVDHERALGALQRLGRAVTQGTGDSYTAYVAEASDVIRNGFLVRDGLDPDGARFEGGSGSGPLAPVAGYPRGSWGREPAEILVDISGVTGTRRLRVVSAHLKSKRETAYDSDRTGEKWERLRVVQASALLDLARRRLEQDPSELILIAADVNNVEGSATRAVLTGRIDPAMLLSPRDCIGDGGLLSCDLPESRPFLVEIAADDPDLEGRGSFRYHRRDELIDEIFATPSAAALARQPGSAGADYDVSLVGRIGRGSDHLMLRVTLRFGSEP